MEFLGSKGVAAELSIVLFLGCVDTLTFLATNPGRAVSPEESTLDVPLSLDGVLARTVVVKEGVACPQE